MTVRRVCVSVLAVVFAGWFAVIETNRRWKWGES